MASLEERLAAASTFLLQSPPGEVNDVFSDIRTLVAADAELEQGILPALKQYNKEQLTVVDLGGKKVLVTPVSRLGGQEEDGDEKSAEERHVDPEGQRSFVVDHMKVSAHSPLPLPVDHSTESLRSSLSSLLASYVANHYADGVSAVYALEDPAYPPPPPSAPAAEEKRPEGEAEHGVGETGSIAENVEGGEKDVAEVAAETVEAAEEALDKNEGEAVQPAAPTIEGEGGEGGQEEKQKEDKMDLGTPAAPSAIEEKEKVEPPPPSPSRLFGLYFVGNKYNPSNYWTGRWRSQYELDWEKGTLEGSVKIQVHYYEQGNVQLSTTLSTSFPLPPSPSLSAEAVIAALKSSEQSFQRQLSSTYAEMSEESFKGLRRALPKTKSKIEWGAVAGGGMRIGKAIGGQ